MCGSKQYGFHLEIDLKKNQKRRDSNPGSPSYEAAALPSEPSHFDLNFLLYKKVYANFKTIHMNGTERSPEGCFSCRGMLDFEEDCMIGVVSH